MSVLWAAVERPRVSEALEVLWKAGVSNDRLEVRSSTPLSAHQIPPGQLRRSFVLPVAIAGAVLGGGTMIWAAVATSFSYPMYTGGMEIAAGPPLGIVTFEGVALGLILATVGAVLIESGLFRRREASPLDRRVAEGLVLLRIEGSAETLDEIAAGLEAVGGELSRSDDKEP